MKEHPHSEEEVRQKAIDLYLSGWKIANICTALGRSQSWFYKWLQRFHEDEESWYQDRSRIPHHQPCKIAPETEQVIVQTRKTLRATPYAQYGPQAIYFRMLMEGHIPPHRGTIARVLKRQNLVPPRDSKRYAAKGKNYPYQYGLAHQMDFVGPRYLAGGTRYYFLSLVDCDSHWCQTAVLEHRNACAAVQQLVRFWKTVGIPDFLQMDNELCFWGSLKDPRAVGQVIRLCLLHRVTPVFIPLREPWRNGVIECFNRTLQKNVLEERHAHLLQVKQAVTIFDRVHNETHHYSSQGGQTPTQAWQRLGYPLKPLAPAYQLPDGKLPLEAGEIRVIRFIRKDRRFNVFGLSFPVPSKVLYEYVQGVILTEEHRLVLFWDREYIRDFPFILYP
jgi:transposase InsO family protein